MKGSKGISYKQKWQKKDHERFHHRTIMTITYHRHTLAVPHLSILLHLPEDQLLSDDLKVWQHSPRLPHILRFSWHFHFQFIPLLLFISQIIMIKLWHQLYSLSLSSVECDHFTFIQTGDFNFTWEIFFTRISRKNCFYCWSQSNKWSCRHSFFYGKSMSHTLFSIIHFCYFHASLFHFCNYYFPYHNKAIKW